jgi:hypothetical protein
MRLVEVDSFVEMWDMHEKFEGHGGVHRLSSEMLEGGTTIFRAT